MTNSHPSFSIKALKNAGDSLALPFWLEIPGGQRWLCSKLLRLLPGKRAVLYLEKSHEDGSTEACVCKVFFRHRDYKRETQGHALLTRHSIQTPELMEQIDGKDYWLILYRFVGGPTLEELAHRPDTREHQLALRQTVTQVARMHKAGLRQVDIHLGNFIVCDGSAYVVDTAAVTAHQAPLEATLAAENFGDLLAQYPLQAIDTPENLWPEYQAGNPSPNWSVETLPSAVDKMRGLRWKHYRSKLTRECSEFSVDHNWQRFAVWRKSENDQALTSLLGRMDQAMEEGQYLKQGNTATVARYSQADRELVIKRYNIKNFRHALSRAWRPSRGWQSWHNAYYLIFIGLETPLPLALVEHRCGPLRGRAYLMSEYCTGQSLLRYVEDAKPEAVKSIITEMANIINLYLEAGISHGDMKADNFLVDDSRIIITDLDPMAFHSSDDRCARALNRDIRRLLANWTGDKLALVKQTLAAKLRPELEVS